VAELTALLKVYGTTDASGRKSISIEGVRSLYEKSQFPDEWRAQLTAKGVNPSKLGLLKLLGGIVDMAYRQIGTAAGRAQMAMDIALGKDTQLNMTSAMGLANSMCPAGPPVATPKDQAASAHA
jgi:hypothetical protein